MILFYRISVPNIFTVFLQHRILGFGRCAFRAMDKFIIDRGRSAFVNGSLRVRNKGGAGPETQSRCAES